MRRLLVVFVSACGAMSESAHRELAEGVEARNAARVHAAEEELRSRGYILVPDTAVRQLLLDEGIRERCRVLASALDQTIKVRVTEPPRTIEVTALLSDACAFFRAQRSTLDVTKPDGTSGRLVHLPVPRLVARGPNGEIVKVETRSRVITKHKVRVDRTCNRMAMVQLDPLERASQLVVVWTASAELRTIAMPFDREDLEVECAKNLY